MAVSEPILAVNVARLQLFHGEATGKKNLWRSLDRGHKLLQPRRNGFWGSFWELSVRWASVRLKGLFLTIVFLLVFPLSGASADLGFARSLALEQDCYRALSEVKRFEFLSQPTPESLMIKLPCLAQQGEWTGFEDQLPLFLAQSEVPATNRREVIFQAFEHYIQTGQESKALKLSSNLGIIGREYPTKQASSVWQDPEGAARASAWLPGAGLWMAGRKTSAVVSFGLNTGFLYGTWWAVTHRAPAMGLILMFFEVSWYQGGINAATEAVQENNHARLAEEQRAWLLDIKAKF